MAEITLNRSGVGAVVGHVVAGRVPEHMGVHLQRQPGLLAGPLDHPIEAVPGERGATFGNEHECRLRVLLPPQRPQLITTDRVPRRVAPLLALNMHLGRSEVEASHAISVGAAPLLAQ